MNLTDFATRADGIVALADKVIPTFKVTQYGIDYDSAAYAAFRSAGLSFLAGTFGEEHSYYREFDQGTQQQHKSSAEAGRGSSSQPETRLLEAGRRRPGPWPPPRSSAISWTWPSTS